MKLNILQIIAVLRVLFTIVCGAFLVYAIIQCNVYVSAVLSLLGVISAAILFKYTDEIH